MNARSWRERLADRPWAIRRIALVGGVLALAVSLFGAWYSLPRSDDDSRSAAAPRAGSAGAFPLVPYPTPRPIANVAFEDGAGAKRSLAAFRGKVVLLNVWATWCAPCRKEMPTLDRLQARLGGADFEVVALSIDRDGPAIVRRFLDETDVRALKLYIDTSTEAMAKLAIVGVPTTLLIDREGREVARHAGIADWDRPEVVALINRYLTKDGP